MKMGVINFNLFIHKSLIEYFFYKVFKRGRCHITNESFSDWTHISRHDTNKNVLII